MNTYNSEAIDFFLLVLTSGLIAAAALAVASAIAFSLVFVLYRERHAAAPAEKRTEVAAIKSRPADTRAMVAG